MKNLIFVCSFLVLVFLVKSDNFGSSYDKPVQSQVKKGNYIPSDLITPAKLRNLPIPTTGEDYAFYQSIGKITNIVIGNFSRGENRITLISDKDADGIVDELVYWFEDISKFQKVNHPEIMYSPEKFKELKLAIINGDKKELSPNEEGLKYLKGVLSQSVMNINISKSDLGYIVSVLDADNRKKVRLSYQFANNGNRGVDLIFDVKYYNVINNLVKPVIPNSVYCSGSFDSVALSITDELTELTRKNMTGSVQ